MFKIFDEFAEMFKCSFKDCSNSENENKDSIASSLGVLLWIVGNEDGDFSKVEKEKAKEIIKKYTGVSENEIPEIMKKSNEAALNRIDMHEFTRKLNKELSREDKIMFIEDLFRLGCADGSLDYDEVEMIKKIANLLHIHKNDFINSKIKIMKECKIN